MICEILHPIFDALDDEFRFHGLDCSGNEKRSGKHEGRWAMHKICVALNKEKGIASLTKSVRYLESATRLNCYRYYKSHAGLCQDVGKAQYLRRIN